MDILDLLCREVAAGSIVLVNIADESLELAQAVWRPAIVVCLQPHTTDSIHATVFTDEHDGRYMPDFLGLQIGPNLYKNAPTTYRVEATHGFGLLEWCWPDELRRYEVALAAGLKKDQRGA